MEGCASTIQGHNNCNHQKHGTAREVSSLELSEGQWFCPLPDFRILASRTMASKTARLGWFVATTLGKYYIIHVLQLYLFRFLSYWDHSYWSIINTCWPTEKHFMIILQASTAGLCSLYWKLVGKGRQGSLIKLPKKQKNPFGWYPMPRIDSSTRGRQNSQGCEFVIWGWWLPI